MITDAATVLPYMEKQRNLHSTGITILGTCGFGNRFLRRPLPPKLTDAITTPEIKHVECFRTHEIGQ